MLYELNIILHALWAHLQGKYVELDKMQTIEKGLNAESHTDMYAPQEFLSVCIVNEFYSHCYMVVCALCNGRLIKYSYIFLKLPNPECSKCNNEIVHIKCMLLCAIFV